MEKHAVFDFKLIGKNLWHLKYRILSYKNLMLSTNYFKCVHQPYTNLHLTTINNQKNIHVALGIKSDNNQNITFQKCENGTSK